MKSNEFKYIDICAGIGGFRLPLDKMGGECVFSSDIDKFARQTYQANYGDMPSGDIAEVDLSEIPSHNLLVAGFPCQPFSVSGVSKRNSLGVSHGFDDQTQGTVFFRILHVIHNKQPEVVLLENVKNLRSHDKGNTYRVILSSLNEAGYFVFDQVIDAQYYVPQHRERIFIVAFRKDLFINYELPDFSFPDQPTTRLFELKDVLESDVPAKYTMSDRMWGTLQAHRARHKAKGNGFGYGLIDPEVDQVTTRTLKQRYYKDGSEILIKQKNANPRRLTPRECARLMGFDDSFQIVVSDTQAYRQFGNAVVVPVAEAVVGEIFATLEKRNLLFSTMAL